MLPLSLSHSQVLACLFCYKRRYNKEAIHQEERVQEEIIHTANKENWALGHGECCGNNIEIMIE